MPCQGVESGDSGKPKLDLQGGVEAFIVPESVGGGVETSNDCVHMKRDRPGVELAERKRPPSLRRAEPGGVVSGTAGRTSPAAEPTRTMALTDTAPRGTAGFSIQNSKPVFQEGGCSDGVGKTETLAGQS